MSVTGSQAARKRAALAGRFGLGCFFSLFAIIGIGVSIPLLITPAIGFAGARSWTRTPCTLLESGVETSRSSKGGSTYAVRVRYRYERHGKTYESSRYSFADGVFSSGYDSKKAVVDRLQPGSQAYCYVDPKRPESAVLERDFDAGCLIAIVPLAFTLVGVGGLFFVIRSARRSRGPALPPGGGALTVPPARAQAAPGGAAPLNPGMGRVGKFIFLLIIAAFWNGISWVFAWEAYAGNGDGCMKVFCLPFVLVGAALLAGAAYTFLALFNPRPSFQITPSDPSLGDEIQVAWSTEGKVDKIARWSVFLEGREEVSYRQGTRTTTEKDVFLKLEIARGEGGQGLRRGAAQVKIPAGTMHSVRLSNNKILWRVVAHAEIPKWPDVNDEYELEIRPQRIDGDLGLSSAGPLPNYQCAHETGVERNWMVMLRRVPPAYFPGDALEGELNWNLPGGADALYLRLYHRTEGKGTTDVIVAAEQTFPKPDGHAHKPFTFKLPAGPYSFSGKLVTLIWGVEAVLEPGGDSRRMEFVLSPSGEELKLRPEP